MTLPPEIAARLQALQSLLESRDLELAETVAIRLGGCLSGFSALLASEPARRRRYHALAWAGRAHGFNRVTRHDIHASIDAGFLGGELAGAPGLEEGEWDIEVAHTAMGAHRTVARHAARPRRN